MDMTHASPSEHSISFWHPAALIATFFGVGKIKFAPGTWGSVATFPFLWLVGKGLTYVIPVTIDPNIQVLQSFGALFGILVALFILGCWASHVYAVKSGKEDPGEIVIDEVVGQGLVIFAVIPLSVLQPQSITFLVVIMGVALALFRYFDIRKPWPINWCDKNVKGGVGVMLDDVVAAVMSIVVFYAGWFIYQDFLLATAK